MTRRRWTARDLRTLRDELGIRTLRWLMDENLPPLAKDREESVIDRASWAQRKEGT